MNPQSELERELLDLLDQLESDSHSSELRLKMRGLLMANSELRTYFIQHAHLVGGLRWMVQPVSVDTAGNIRPQTAPRLSQNPRALPLRFANYLFNVRWPVAFATLIVAVVSYGTFALVAWNLRPDRLPNQIPGSDGTVAVVSNSADVHWSPKMEPKGDQASIREGELLKIDSGLMQLELKRGVTLLVEGPAEWTIEGENHATLRSGKLLATVSNQAVGFTLDTPTTQIVDLGTEFGVEIAGGGTTEVQVFRGKVELFPNARDNPSQSAKQPIQLQAGSGIRIEPNGTNQPTLRHVATTPGRFTRQIPPNNAKRLRVSGALASSEWPTCEVRHLIDGSGMHGESHGAVATDTMWLTIPHKNKNAFVLFDLGRVCRLESMKVWNYNDHFSKLPFYESRGVKQADIYVSRTGEWDPLTRPDNWKLVVENREFSLADGTADYASPDKIALNNVETRFVAIVIDEQYQLRKDAPVPDDCVGLSEVQFFGERLVSPPNSTKK
jgi:hypothetical protein